MEVATVEQRWVQPRSSFVGTSLPSRRAVVGSAVDGRVKFYHIRAGDRVQQGEALASLRIETINIQISEAEAELELRRQELRELENGPLPEEKAQAKARLEAAGALMHYADSKFKRTTELFKQGRTISQEEFDDAMSRYRNLSELYKAANEAYKLVMIGPREEKIAQAAARVAAQQEAVNFLKDRESKYEVKAPFDGYVVKEHTQQGEWVTQGQHVAEVIELDPIEIEVFVPESSVVHQKIGATVPVTFDALPGQQFEGTIDRVVPQADVRSRAFPVKIRLDNPEKEGTHLLRAGMFARVLLATGPTVLANLAPKDAVVLSGAPKVFVVSRHGNQNAGVARPAPVQLGVADGNDIQLIGEIKKGDLVVTVGNERLPPKEQEVQFTPAKPETPQR